MVLTQSHDQLAGTFQDGATVLCEGITPPEGFPTVITDGLVVETTVQYFAGPCLFRGQAEGDPVERVAGTVECNLGTTLDPLILTGTWEMTS